MNKRYITAVILFLSLFFIQCEDVVEVDLDAEEPRLIVDALIRIDTSQRLTPALIKVSLSASFFDAIEPAQVEDMVLLNETTGDFVPYGEKPDAPGIYQPIPTTQSPVINNQIVTAFLTQPEDRYLLSFTWNEQQYFAQTVFAPSVPINSLEQSDTTLFGDDETAITVNFTDPADREDYYVFDMDFNEYITSDDQFIGGQEFEFTYFYDKEVDPGDLVTINILGATESFFNYMNGILEQSQQGANGPFQTPTATIRGNFLIFTGIDNIDQFNNVDRPEDFILGYFALSQTHSASILIEE